jgi:hypothetical protein
LHFKLNFVAKAYAAATFLMDYLKTEAPFWKKRHLAAGKEPGDWVEAKAQDFSAAQKWRGREFSIGVFWISACRRGAPSGSES